MELKVLLTLTVAVLLYLTVGTFLFSYLERPDPDKALQPVVAWENYTQRLHERLNCTTLDDLRALLKETMEAYDKGEIDPFNSTDPDQWDHAQAFFFVGTVITTIGYGNYSPQTYGGRVAVILYGLLGIPLCLIFLAGLGENLVGRVKKIEQHFNCCHRFGRLWHVIRVLMMITVGWVFFIMLPAIVFMSLEEWTYMDSVYYCFVTLSTIGFGDLVPCKTNKDYRIVYRILTVFWVYVGLAWLSSVMALISEILRKGIIDSECIPRKTTHSDKMETMQPEQDGIVISSSL